MPGRRRQFALDARRGFAIPFGMSDDCVGHTGVASILHETMWSVTDAAEEGSRSPRLSSWSDIEGRAIGTRQRGGFPRRAAQS
jgi:hypothetical protein